MMRFIDAALSYRLESAEWLPTLELIAALRQQRPELGAACESIGGTWMTYGGPNSPMNHAIGLGLRGPVSEAELDRIEAFYRERESICEIVVSPHADFSLLKLLGERAYRVTEWNTVMYRELTPGAHAGVEGLDIRRVEAEDSELWAGVVARGFSDVQPVMPDLYAPLAAAPSARSFLVWIDGKPVAGAGMSVFPTEGIAPLYGAATLPEYRGRGIQNALIQIRLQEAAEAGCGLAVVCTWPGSASHRNVARNGFTLAYTKIALQRKI